MDFEDDLKDIDDKLVKELTDIAREKVDYWDVRSGVSHGATLDFTDLKSKEISSHYITECGIRAFEHWGNLDSLHVLEKTKSDIPWLQEYIDDVVEDLRKDHNVIISKKN